MTIEFNSSGLIIQGALTAAGTASAPITFTSRQATPSHGDWYGVRFEAGARGNLSYATIAYAGAYPGYSPYGALALQDSSPTLDHLTIAHSSSYGAAIVGGRVTISNSSITQASVGLNVDHATVAIHNSVIANDSFGISNCAGCSVVHAENNYWGTPSSPAPYGSGPGISTHQVSVTDPNTGQTYTYNVADVAVEPWLGEGATLQPYAAAPGQFDALAANSDGSYDVTDKDQTVYHFSPGGALQRITDRNGNVTSLGYNGGGQLTAVSAAGGRALALSYNGDGCIASVTGNSGRGITFGYSPAGDLISVTDPRGHTTGSAYDAVGRTVAVTDALGRAATLGYDAGDDVITRTDALGHSTLTAYDAEGNRLSGASPRGDITTHGYDDANYLTSLASGAHGMVCTYNGDHVRVGSAVDGVSTGDVLDLAAGLPTVLQQGTSGVTTTYLYGAGLLGQDDGTDLQTLLPDALGSTRLVVGSGGAVVGHASYDAYGAQTVSGAGSVFGFTDQQTDAASGLVFLRARYYDPATGVFLGWRGAHVCMGTAAVPAARGHDGAARPRPTAVPDASQLFPWAHRDPAVPHARVVGGLGRGSRSV